MDHVGVLCPEDVAHARAGHDQDAAPAAPGAEGHLDVLTAPLGHVGVVSAHALPVVSPNAEDATGQGRRRIDIRIFVRGVPLLNERLPPEGQRPIESTNVVVGWHVLVEVVLRDDVQDGHHQRPVVFGQRQLLQQRLHPLLAHHAVGLHEHDHRAADQGCADHLGSDQPLPLLVPVHLHLGVYCFQLLVELPLWSIAVIDEQDLVHNLHGAVRKHRSHRGADMGPSLVQVWDDQRDPGQVAGLELTQAGLVPDLTWRRKRRQRAGELHRRSRRLRRRRGAGYGRRSGPLRVAPKLRSRRPLQRRQGAACCLPHRAASLDHLLEQGMTALLQQAVQVGARGLADVLHCAPF
mmetsp:Transcript_71274/g.170254  ORF Transcript_71274/g.170254 Transcript_71274/m.170254 type:complete len:350 (+) Transcript_71274:250-1299(+)